MKKENIELLSNVVKKLYDRNNLAYHNFNHIQDMLNLSEKYNCELTMGQLIAILYHDSAFVPCSTDNEERSIENMYIQMSKENMSFYDRNELAIAEQIILDIKEHIPTREESKLVLDLNSAILGFEPKIFKEYGKALYNEYKTVFTNEPDKSTEIIFHEDTIELGTKILARNNIYYTELFKNIYEKRATINLLTMINESKSILNNFKED